MKCKKEQQQIAAMHSTPFSQSVAPHLMVMQHVRAGRQHAALAAGISDMQPIT